MIIFYLWHNIHYVLFFKAPFHKAVSTKRCNRYLDAQLSFTTMNFNKNFIVSVLLYVYQSDGIFCNTLTKHKEAIQSYIMTGYESNWHPCERLSDRGDYSSNAPQIIMNLNDIHTLNLKSTFAYTTCLLVHYDVSSRESLSALTEFGWKAINHVRLAIVMRLRSGITLEMAKNTSNLPYLMAAQYDDGKEQFLCPIVGEGKTEFGQVMCRKSYLSYKNKKLRIGGVGLLPDAWPGRPGRMNARIVLSSDRSKLICTIWTKQYISQTNFSCPIVVIISYTIT